MTLSSFIESSNSFKSSFCFLVRFTGVSTLIRHNRSLPCYAGKLNLVLTESGEVYPCEILPQSLGNVRDHDYDIMQVTRTEQAMDVLRSVSASNPHCRTCTHECNYITNILFNPAMYPALMREYLRL